MAAKLRSISGLIPWFLAFKALLFGLAWFFLPFWIFVIVALLLYLSPFFRPFSLLTPFILALVFAGLLAPSPGSAVFLGVVFFLISGIKDLVFIERSSAYEMLSFLLFFLLFLFFFSKIGSQEPSSAYFFSLAMGWLYYLLVKRTRDDVVHEEERNLLRERVLIAVLSLTFVEFAWATLFLPFNVLYSTAFLLLVAVLSVEFGMAYREEKLDRGKILGNVSLFFVIIVFLLASNRWSL